MAKSSKPPAVALPPTPRASLHITGSQAKQLHRLGPGSKVRLHVTGRVTDLGQDSYPGEGPTARIEVHKVRPVASMNGTAIRSGGLRARRPTPRAPKPQ